MCMPSHIEAVFLSNGEPLDANKLKGYEVDDWEFYQKRRDGVAFSINTIESCRIEFDAAAFVLWYNLDINLNDNEVQRMIKEISVL